MRRILFILAASVTALALCLWQGNRLCLRTAERELTHRIELSARLLLHHLLMHEDRLIRRIRDGSTQDIPITTDGETLGVFEFYIDTTEAKVQSLFRTLALSVGGLIVIVMMAPLAAAMLFARQVRVSNRHLEQARRNAEEAECTKSAFLANISHEIRTPMNGIIALADCWTSPS